MRYLKNLKTKAISAIFLTIFVSGCAGFNSPPPTVGTPVPRLDPRDEARCIDPGVRGNAVQALADNRLALAECSRKHANVVGQYNEVYQEAQGQ